MQRNLKLAISSLLLTASCAVSADTIFAPDNSDAGSLNPFPVRMLPVLVSVGANGEVSDIAPAYRLSPSFRRLLDRNVAEMVAGPAVDKHGKSVSSQFILNLALAASPREDGAYDVRLQYVSTQPVPSGKWFWSHTDGHRLALLDESRRSFDHARPAPSIDRGQAHQSVQTPVNRPVEVQSAAGQPPSRSDGSPPR